jgi:D-arabinose 1-dehydrogenase-like Zn-dependent alcohol dehydrogenase
MIELTYPRSCHSDCHRLYNEWSNTPRPLVPGHEIVGIVVRRGDKARYNVGERVSVGTIVGCCFQCEACKNGEESYCRYAIDTYVGTHVATKTRCHGGFAEGMVVDSRFAFKVPESLPSSTCAPLMCAGATVFSPLKRYCKPTHSIGVVGIGGLGHFALQFARALQIKEIVALTGSADKGPAARSFGATDVLVTSDKAAMKKRAGTLDFMLVTVSADLNWLDYNRLLKVGGHMCLVGLPPNDIKLNPFQLTSKRLSFSGSNTASIAETKEMLELAAEYKIRAAVELLPLSADGCNEAVRRIMKNTPRYRCVMVKEDVKL